MRHLLTLCFVALCAVACVATDWHHVAAPGLAFASLAACAPAGGRNWSFPRVLDFRLQPLRLGGLSSADDGLYDFDINGADDIIKLEGGVTDPWVDDHVTAVWGAPTGSVVSYTGRFSHFAVSVESATAASNGPHLWAVAANDWYLDIETDEIKMRQEVGAGLGLHPVPQVVALAAFDTDQTTQTEIIRVAGRPRPQRFRYVGRRGLTVNFQSVSRFALACTSASNNSLAFSANANVTLWLWGLLARNGQNKAVEEADAMPLEEPSYIGRTTGAR